MQNARQNKRHAHIQLMKFIQVRAKYIYEKKNGRVTETKTNEMKQK